MPISQQNAVTHGISGMLNNQIVFRQRGGKTILSYRPAKSSKPPSEKQLAKRQAFKDASAYAKGVLKNDALRALYEPLETPLLNAYNLALRDYLKKPVINAILQDDYTGNAGSRLLIAAYDDMELTKVTVTLHNGNGTTYQHGEAQLAADRPMYEYILQSDIPAGDSVVATVTATDIPGNKTANQTVIFDATGI